MSGQRQGRRIAILAADGVEQAELEQPKQAVEQAGAATERLSHQAAVKFVRAFVTGGKPVGVICHGPWTLVEADVVRGRTLTSWPSLRTDIRNAGGTVVGQEVVTDGNITSSRMPGDLPAFCARIVEQFSAAAPQRTDAN